MPMAMDFCELDHENPALLPTWFDVHGVTVSQESVIERWHE